MNKIILMTGALLLTGCSALNTLHRADSALNVLDALEQVVDDQYHGLANTQVCLPPGDQRARAEKAVVVMGWKVVPGQDANAPCVKFSREVK